MKKNTSDEAVSVVVALMLVLAIIATCIAVYSATYVPGLKQNSEIMHTNDVQYSFMRFSSDIDNLYSLSKPAQFTEPLSLGGGDVLLSPIKSSGTIEIGPQKNIGRIDVAGFVSIPIHTVDVSYVPSYSAWELQGYLWRNGTLWITKNEKRTPVLSQSYTVEDGLRSEKEKIEDWLTSMIHESSSGDLLVCSIDMQQVPNKTGITGSGMANLKAKSVIDSTEEFTLFPGSYTLSLYSANEALIESRIFTVDSNKKLIIQRVVLEVSVE